MIPITRLFSIVLLVSLLLSAGAAMAMDTPTIQVPAPGATLGPNYDISGSMPHRAFLVVITDCVRVDTGEVLRSVPGIRHWTNADGRFGFRCASPRVSFGDTTLTLEYHVRCFEVTASEGNGPEAVVNCHMAQ